MRPRWMATLLAALLTAACSNTDSGTPNGPCGSNNTCPVGFTCDVRTNICVANAIDAGVVGGAPDAARAIDAGGGTTVDAGGGTTVDAGVTVASHIAPRFTSPVNSRTVSFDVGADVEGATLECKTDATDFAACTTPFQVTFSSDGQHSASVRARANGVTEPTPHSVSFVIDTVAPIIAIDSPPLDATIGVNATLTFSSNEPVKSFSCSFDDGDPVDCGAGTTGSRPIDLANGRHTAHVTGVDLAGNPGNTASVSFTFDITALTVAIDARRTPCASEKITFSANKPGATFACTLDATTGPCTSPFALPGGLAGGSHSFSVTATLGAATASNGATFTLDQTAPTVSVDPPRTDLFGFADPRGTVAFHTNKAGLDALCGVDNLGTTDCSAQLTDGQFFYGPLGDAPPDRHTVTVVVTDVCNRTASDAVTFAVDATPPAPCLTHMETGRGLDVFDAGGTCLGGTAKSGPTGSLTFNAEAGNYACSLSSGATQLPIASCAPGTPFAFTGLTDAANGTTWTLRIAGVDAHGNSSVSFIDWTVDATAPQVTLGAATSDGAAGTMTVAFTIAPVTGEVGARAEGLSFPTCSLDGRNCVCAATGTAGSMTCSQVPAGDHLASVRAQDKWTNLGGTATSASPILMTYGPNSGRAILIGHDYVHTNDGALGVLALALGDVPGKKSGVFARDVRVLSLRGNDAGFDNVVASAAWSGVDVAGSDVLGDPTKLAGELVDHDVLLVFDQGDGAASAAIGTAWNTKGGGGETLLTHFLNSGGVVIVLDGWVADDAEPTVSETFRVLSGAGDDPALVVTGSSAVIGQRAGTVDYQALLDEALGRDASDLKGAASYAPFAGTVVFDPSGAESTTGQPREVYSDRTLFDNEGPSAVVLEKVFPRYTVALAPPTHTGLFGNIYFPGEAMGLTPVANASIHYDCAFLCNQEGCTTTACTSDGAGGFVFPPSGNYSLELVAKDPAQRPGRVLQVFVNVALQVSFIDLGANEGGSHTVCALAPAPPATNPVTYEPNISATLDDGVDPRCVDALGAGAVSLTTIDCINFGGNTSVFVTATDAKGNQGFGNLTIDFPACNVGLR